MSTVEIRKGWPSIYAYDLALPVNSDQSSSIVEGMVLYEDDNGEWKYGCPKGRIPYVTAPEQFPTAKDVARVQDSTFPGALDGSTGVGQLGRKKMGAVSLTNAIEFHTTEYSGTVANKVVWADPADGAIKEITDSSAQQAIGYCRGTATDEATGETVAIIVASVALVEA